MTANTPTQATQIKSDTGIRIFDTPVESLPDDLYIPPHAFAVWLEQFAGPLDFLLYLVKKNNFDLVDTAILPITEQYLSYISELDDTYFELAGDYLLMASTLIAIKSELLLPEPEPSDGEVSPKARLIRRLEEYAQIKEVSRRLDGLIRFERDVFVAFASLPDVKTQAQPPKFCADLLVSSLVNMQIKPDYQMHHIKNDPVPLPERIANISRMLSQQGRATFHELLDKTQGRMGVVVSFMAVLELIKRGLVGFVDEGVVDKDFVGEDKNQKDLTKTSKTDPTHVMTENIGEQLLYWLC